MRVYPVKSNFIYPEIKETDFKFGSGQLGGKILREDGDWRDFLPPEEDQNKYGVESSACYVEAIQHGVATIEEEDFNEKDNNYAARFNALLSGGSIDGGDPLKAAYSIRHDGLVKDSSMPFSDVIKTWNDYHSWKGVDEKVVRAEGNGYVIAKDFGYDIVFQRNEPVKTKYLKAKNALKYCPLPVSVCAWFEDKGQYIKPEGMRDNHLVLLVYIDENNRPYIWDTYSPYLKVLEPFYNFDFGMRISVTKKEQTELKKTLAEYIQQAINLLLELVGIKKKELEEIQKTDPSFKIYSQSVIALGTDASPLDNAPDELSCAESINEILKKAGYPIKTDNPLSTYYLYLALKNSKDWERIYTAERGCIIISPTGYGERRLPSGELAVKHGHAGIVGENGEIFSSNSAKQGIWDKHWTVDLWEDYFVKQGGYILAYFKKR